MTAALTASTPQRPVPVISPDGSRPATAPPKLVKHLAQVPDPRQARGKLTQRLLHVRTGIGDQGVPMAEQRAERTHRVGGPERTPQEAHRVQILEPLTVTHVALPAGNVFHVASVDQADLKATRLQDL